MKSVSVWTLAIMLAAPASSALADNWKNENDRSRYRSHYNDRDYKRERSERRRDQFDRIPYGHLPPRGECRDWYAELPPGQQPPPYKC